MERQRAPTYIDPAQLAHDNLYYYQQHDTNHNYDHTTNTDHERGLDTTTDYNTNYDHHTDRNSNTYHNLHHTNYHSDNLDDTTTLDPHAVTSHEVHHINTGDTTATTKFTTTKKLTKKIWDQ